MQFLHDAQTGNVTTPGRISQLKISRRFDISITRERFKSISSDKPIKISRPGLCSFLPSGSDPISQPDASDVQTLKFSWKNIGEIILLMP